MRILIISQYFWPEPFIINDLARTLAAAGHEIVVATGKPNYPTGKIAPGYHRRGLQRETYGGAVEVIRVPLRPRGRAGAIALSLNYLSFVLSSLQHLPRLFRGRSFDAILVFCVSPITAAIPALVLKRQMGAHLALWIQDLWPESVAATGFVRNRVILKALELIVRLIYRGADTLLVQSEAFIGPISRHVEPQKIVYYPNFAPSLPAEKSALPSRIHELFDGHFCVVFAGNLGKAQSLETITAAARLLLGTPAIRILVAGTGSEASWLKATAADQDLRNIHLLGKLDVELMPELFARADALLVTLRDDEALNATVPSKIQAYMSAGKPIVGALNGEGARLIESSKAGLTVCAGDAAGLAARILTLHEMSSTTRATMGRAAKAHFDANFEVGRAAERLVEILQARMRG